VGSWYSLSGLKVSGKVNVIKVRFLLLVAPVRIVSAAVYVMQFILL